MKWAWVPHLPGKGCCRDTWTRLNGALVQLWLSSQLLLNKKFTLNVFLSFSFLPVTGEIVWLYLNG